MTKLDEVVSYVVHGYAKESRRPLTRTKLVKLCYLADLRASERRHKPVTGVTYKSYYFGPYAPEILQAAEEQPSIITSSRRVRADGAPYYAYEPGPTAPKYRLLSDVDKRLIDEILAEYSDFKLRTLLDTVYSTKPYRAARMTEKIKL